MINFLLSGKSWIRYLLFILSIALIIYWIPKQGKFQYEFEKGKPWLHKDLIAPFTYAIEKTPEQIEAEKLEIKENFNPYYYQEENKEEKRTKTFVSNLEKEYSTLIKPNKNLTYFKTRGLNTLQEIYKNGVIDLAEDHEGKELSGIVLVKSNIAENHPISDFFTEEEALAYARSKIEEDTTLQKEFFRQTLIAAIHPNIFYNQELSEKKLNELLNQVSLTKGLVQEGEKIITRGNIVTDEKFQVLTSLKNNYELEEFEGNRKYIVLIGYILVILFIFIIFGFYLNYFRKDVFRTNKSLILILLNILIFIFLGTYITTQQIFSVYVIPYAIVPIILLAFFGPRVAIISHLMVILISGLFVPNSFEFLFLQIMAGFMAILSMSRIRYLSQFFIASIMIVFSYYVSFLALKFIQVGSLVEIEWENLLWFTANFVLTLLAYPLIYAFEKMFGFVSDITLMELSDINKKLLRKLAMKAPGTFQHSLQVANLSEAVLNEIGGNALLARVGALYHDIGKMERPYYFIENQKYTENPHDNISDEESAKIIIEHVTKGIEMAREANLPEEIMKFIRTHHGTSRVEYFYRNYIKNKTIDEIDDSKFRYPGPKPFSKETAVVMLVDTVEAASRSLKNPDEESLDSLIDKVIDHKLADNQLDNADITLREVNLIKVRLKKLLKSIYHIRVEYPGMEKE